MNIKELDILVRRKAFIRSEGVCEVCEGAECGNEVLEDHHIISRRHLLTRWADFNHIVVGRICHEKAQKVREFVRVNRPGQWRRLRRAEMRLAKGGYHDRNLFPERIRARIKRRSKVL